MEENSIYIIVVSIYIVALAPDLLTLFQMIRRPQLPHLLKNRIIRAHWTVLIIAVPLFLFVTALQVNIFNYSPPIPYHQHKKITLDDFNGLKIPGQTLQGQNEFAFINTTIDYRITYEGVEIISYFHPARSYVYIDNLEDKDLLTHELYHFRITELWARKLRKEVSLLPDKPTRSQLALMYQEAHDGENAMQQAYDYGVDHGYLLGKQIQWQLQIDSLLSEYDQYRHTSIQF